MTSGDNRKGQRDEEPFGQFLRRKRTEKSISLRRLAKMLSVSAPYLFEVEKGRKPPLALERILLASRILLLTKEEEIRMLDLAGEAKKSDIAPDLPEYINANTVVREALRAARDLGADEGDWQRFTERLLKMSRKEERHYDHRKTDGCTA